MIQFSYRISRLTKIDCKVAHKAIVQHYNYKLTENSDPKSIEMQGIIYALIQSEEVDSFISTLNTYTTELAVENKMRTDKTMKYSYNMFTPRTINYLM